MAEITLWKPERDVILHQALGKLAEEIGELQQIVARCLIQGISETDPKSGQPNKERLQEEISDVVAAIRWLRSVGFLRVLSDREQRKFTGFRQWERMLEADIAITSGRVRKTIYALIEERTGIARTKIDDDAQEPMIEIGITEDHKIDLSADVWEAFHVPINIAIDLQDDATVDNLVDAVESRMRKIAEAY